MPKKVDYGLGNRMVGYIRPDFKAPRRRPAGNNYNIFENARGGPYRYGVPLKATIENLRAVSAGLL